MGFACAIAPADDNENISPSNPVFTRISKHTIFLVLIMVALDIQVVSQLLLIRQYVFRGENS